MKKFFALLLVVLMLLPSIVACGEEREDPTTSSTPAATTPSSKPSTTPSSKPSTTPSSKPGTTESSKPGTTESSKPGTTESSKPATGTSSSTTGPVTPDPIPITPPPVVTSWTGKTVRILATTWTGEDPSAPWSQVELTVGPDDWYENTGFGQTINEAVLKRNEFIKNTYGVTIEWINARGSAISNQIQEAVVGDNEETRYNIAMPRMYEAQSIVATQCIYNLADQKYISLSQPYYNQASVEAYTISGFTLFVAGDFSFLDEQTSYLTYYNVALTETDGLKENFPDLYTLVKEGKWTIDQMVSLAKLVSKQVGDPAWDDNDIYGYGTANLSRFFQYSGIQQVSALDGKYVITLSDPKVETLIGKLIDITNEKSCRTKWSGDGYTALGNAFFEGRLLFYDEVIQKSDYMDEQNDEFKVGLLPSPKLNESQYSYHTPCSYQSVVMCIPKATSSRSMSNYFFEVLSYTGNVYIMKAYKDNLRTKLYAETATQSMDIIENYIFPNLCYDQGYMYGWTGLLNTVQSESYSSGENKFTAEYEGSISEAAETVGAWNTAWKYYTDDIE